jgi:hypothetical protein
VKAGWLARGWGIKLGANPEDRLLNLRFADDVLLVARSFRILKTMLEELRHAVGEVGLEMHMGKTKILANAKGRKQTTASQLHLGSEQIDIMAPGESTKYLGRAFTFSDYHDKEIKHRIASGWAKFTAYREELCDKRIALEKRLKHFGSIVTLTVLYSSGCWTMTQERERRLSVAQRRMLRKMAQVPRLKTGCEEAELEDRVSYIIRSTHIAEAAGKAAGIANWTVEQRRRKFRWAGHVARMTDRRWTKLSLTWTPDGSRRSGRPAKRWEDELVAFAETHLDGVSWASVAQDRGAWKQLEEDFVTS